VLLATGFAIVTIVNTEKKVVAVIRHIRRVKGMKER
jgi:hypothetical protein